jgi:hypothetical protein
VEAMGTVAGASLVHGVARWVEHVSMRFHRPLSTRRLRCEVLGAATHG